MTRSAARSGHLPGQAGWTRWDKVNVLSGESEMYQYCIMAVYRLLWRGGALRWADWTPDCCLWGGRLGPSPPIPSRQDEANIHLINNVCVWSLLNKVNVESDTKWSMALFLLLLAICDVLLPCPVHTGHRGRHHKLSGHTWYLIKCHRLTHAPELLVLAWASQCCVA